MTKNECIELIARVCVYYPDRQLSDGVVDAWLDVLDDLEAKQCHEALRTLMRTADDRRRWVQPGELRRICFEQQGLLSIDKTAALTMAREYCDRYEAAMNDPHALTWEPLADELVRDALDALGGAGARQRMDEAQFTAQFRDAYAARAAAHDRAMLAARITRAIESTQ